MALVCISLAANEVELCFVCLLVIYTSDGKLTVIICFYWFFWLLITEVLYVLWMKGLSYILKYFLFFVACVFCYWYVLMNRNFKF